jgi:NTE family protein
VAISATNYQTGAAVTFFEGAPDVEPWTRSNRIGIRVRLTHEHLMASSAIPLLFPPVKLEETYYGDGCVRMSSPMSPAIHLGADRIVAISVRHRKQPAETAAGEIGARQGAPLPISQIAGVLLDAVFLDSLDADAERLERINRTLALIPRERMERSDLHLRPVPALVLRPSTDLGKLAADVYERFPAMLRYLLKGIGASGPAGEDFLSYLAFEPVYVNRVMELGHADTMARRQEIEQFLFDASVPHVPEKIPVRV